MKQNQSQWSVFFCIIQQIEFFSLNEEEKREKELVRELGQVTFRQLKQFKILFLIFKSR